MIRDATAPRVLLCAALADASDEFESPTRLWLRALRTANPELDILLIDNENSPTLQTYLYDAQFFLRQNVEDERDNLALALNFAINKDYEWLAYFQPSELPIPEISGAVEKMSRIGILIAEFVSLPECIITSIRYAYSTNLLSRLNSCQISGAADALRSLCHDEYIILPEVP